MNWDKLLCQTRSNILNGILPRESDNTYKEARNEFQRDYDRTLFSSPVRRLQDKAQVFPLEPHDSVRTRLTHSLEVANVAQGLTRLALESLKGTEHEPSNEQINQLIVLASTAGLIHDLGNPPFGHAGEEAMIEWFKKKLSIDNTLNNSLNIYGQDLGQDFKRFDGNPQTIRLVTCLTMLGDYDGLSLTAGALSVGLKYIASSIDTQETDDHAREKLGFFFSEQELVRKIQRETGTGDARNPITFLVEAADDIVYSTVDLEDGIKKGSLTWKELLQEFEERSIDVGKDSVFGRTKEHLKERLDKSKLILSEQEQDEPLSQLLRTILIGEHVRAASKVFVDNIESIMNGKFTSELLKEGNTAKLWKASKAIARKRVFPSSSILRLEIMGRNVIHNLMDLFWQGIEKAPYAPKEQKGLDYKVYMILSKNYRKVFENAVKLDADENRNIPLNYRRLQLLADYICGMTDTFAVSLHKELFNG